MSNVVIAQPDQNFARNAPESRRVVVVGGGIAGLAAANALVRSPDRPAITLLEQSSRFGGKILTERVDDFVIEAGPDSFLSVKPRGIGLATELGLADVLRGPTPQRRRAFVLSRNRLHPLPEGLSGLVPSRLGPVFGSALLSPAGKLRFASDLMIRPREGDDDESLAAFIRRRLGSDAYDRLIEPLMAGIYAGDGERLSLAATFPKLREGELAHGSLIRGVWAARKAAAANGQATGTPRPAFLTPAGGLGDLVEALTTSLAKAGVELRTRAGVASVRAGFGEADHPYQVVLTSGDVIEADAVILAAPTFAVGKMVKDLNEFLASELLGIPHGSSAIVSLAYRRSQVAHPLDGHGYIIPRIERRPALAATWVSQKWAGRAPADTVLLRVFLGRFGEENVLSRTDDELISLAQAELAETIGVSGEPILTRVARWPWAMPQYVLGHLDRVARIETEVQRHPGLALAGNGYRGVGIPDVIASGEAAASSILNYLRATGDPAGAGRVASEARSG